MTDREQVVPQIIKRWKASREANMVSDFWVPLGAALVIATMAAIIAWARGEDLKGIALTFAIFALIAFIAWGFLEWLQRWQREEERNFEPPRTRIVELERPILLRTHAEPSEAEAAVKEFGEQKVLRELPKFLDACHSVGTRVRDLEAAGYKGKWQSALKLKACEMGLMVRNQDGTHSLVEPPQKDA